MKIPFISRLMQKLESELGNIRLVQVGLAAAVFSVMLLVLSGSDLPSARTIEVGKPAPWDVKASTSVQIVDQEETQRAKRAAAEQVPLVETYNPYATRMSEDKVSETFRVAHELVLLKKNAKLADTPEYKKEYARIVSSFPIELTDETLEALANADPPTLGQYSTNTKHLLGIVTKEGVRDGKLEEATERIVQEARDFPGLSNVHRSVAVEIASKCLIPNRFTDVAATQQAQIRASDAVEPCLRVILPGQVVIREGDIVGEQDLPVLEALGVYKPSVTASGLISYGLLVLGMLGVLATYVGSTLPEVAQSRSSLSALALLIVIFIVVSNYLTTFSVYLAPIALPAMLVTMLISPRLGFILTIMLSIFVGVETGSMAACVTSWLTGSVSVLAVSDMTKRWDVVSSSVLIFVANVLSVLIFSLIAHQETEAIARDTFFFGGLNGLVSALLAAGTMPILERIFGVTTRVRLLEYCNPSEPLLHELLTKAPGTYQHSIMVANLAEAAAQAIGADAILCRAGAYYHDVGKMKQPAMFVENQLGGNNPHDTLSPNLSAMIVISHVELGVELAKTYKLPRSIAQFIPEHHGTSLASFFYAKAKARSDDPVFEEDFRYHGPKPQIKETAIVMLCDGIEAASRTVSPPTKDNLQKLIDKMVNNIIKNGQLDECTLSLRDINTVKASILRTLATHYHSRIAYPDANRPSNATRPASKSGSVAGTNGTEATTPATSATGTPATATPSTEAATPATATAATEAAPATVPSPTTAHSDGAANPTTATSSTTGNSTLGHGNGQ